MSDALDDLRAATRRMVHDARTPLTIITGFADLLVRDPGALGPDGSADALRRISDAARELRAILDAAEEAGHA